MIKGKGKIQNWLLSWCNISVSAISLLVILRRNTITQSIAIGGAGVFGVAAWELRRLGYTAAFFHSGSLSHPQASSTDISKIIRIDCGADKFYTVK